MEPASASHASAPRAGAEAPEVVDLGLAAVASVQRGRPPRPGARPLPYVWGDVLDGPPPRASRWEDRQYVLYHGTEVGEDVRIVHTTLVRVEARNGGRVRVDARATVQRRTLLEQMDQARAWADEVAGRWRARTLRGVARRRRWAAARPAWVARPAVALAGARARVQLAGVEAFRRTVRAAVEVPDVVAGSALRAAAHLGDRLGRSGLRASLADPRGLSVEQKGVLLFLTAAVSGVALLVLNSFFALVMPEHAATYRAALAGAAVQFVSLFGLPIVIEPLLIAATLTIGPALAFGAFLTGKMLAAWVLYLLGDTVHAALIARAGARWRARIAWLQRNADRWGLPVLVLANALPLAPDQIMPVLAVSGMRFRDFMLGIAAGTALRFAVIIAGVYIVGPDRIADFFANPFG